jgi:hypothetical protein
MSSNSHVTSSQQNMTSSGANTMTSSQEQMDLTSLPPNVTQQTLMSTSQDNETLLKPTINIIDKTSPSPGQETEISVVDDYVEVTSQPLEIVTSAEDIITSPNDVMMTPQDDMIMSHIMANPLDDTDLNMVSLSPQNFISAISIGPYFARVIFLNKQTAFNLKRDQQSGVGNTLRTFSLKR